MLKLVNSLTLTYSLLFRKGDDATEDITKKIEQCAQKLNDLTKEIQELLHVQQQRRCAHMHLREFPIAND